MVNIYTFFIAFVVEHTMQIYESLVILGACMNNGIQATYEVLSNASFFPWVNLDVDSLFNCLVLFPCQRMGTK